MRGAYVIVANLNSDKVMRIGKLGDIKMQKGCYCYAGSANGKTTNIENRTERHRKLVERKDGKLHWHIDYFLVDPAVSIDEIRKLEGCEECSISKKLESSADKTIEDFGSTDCDSGCKGHLHYFYSKPSNLNDILEV